MTTFQPGQLVYAASGAAFRYICPVMQAHAVHPILEIDPDDDIDIEDDDPHREMQEEVLGDAVVLHAVFASPPREKIDVEIEDLKSQICTKQNELMKLQNEIKAALSPEQKQALAMHSYMAFIADWLLGKELWVVSEAYGRFNVHHIKHGNDKLDLTVRTSWHGGPSLTVFDYHGNGRGVLSIHQTEADATETLKARYASALKGKVADIKFNGPRGKEELVDLVEAATNSGVAIPPEVDSVVNEWKAKKEIDEIKAKEAAIAEAQKRIDQLKEKLRP